MLRFILLTILAFNNFAASADEKAEIIEWCHDQTASYERAKVKNCIDKENEALSTLKSYPKETEPTISRCVRQTRRGRWHEIKTCVDSQIGTLAENAAKSGDYQTALRIWKLLAQLDDADAQYNLGVLYDKYGYGVSKDDEKAVKYYKAAADSGHSEAQYNLGVKYLNGQGVTQSYEKALQWLTLSAEQGNNDARVALGLMYDSGQGIAQDASKAFQWLMTAARDGDAEAQYNVGIMYEQGKGVKQDYMQAHIWLNLSTFLFPPSQERDDAIAKRRRVTRKLTAQEKHDLAIAYFKGEDVDLPTGYARPEVTDQNEIIFQLLSGAAEQGLAAAQRDLGYVYKYGLVGVAQDGREMKEWFRKAGDKGAVYAQYELGEFYNSKPPFEYTTDYAVARRWYGRAAEQGLVEAMIELGKLYDNGKGGDTDYVRAYMWYDRATAIGSRLALANRTSVEGKMTRRQVAEAQALSRQWGKEYYEQRPVLAQ